MSADSMHLAALRTQSLTFRIEEFVRSEILNIANRTLLQSIIREAKIKNLPDRYVNNIKSDYDGEYLWIWVQFKGKNNEPLDEYFEEGTRRHFIAPRFKKALSWVKDQTKYFSKGHYVSGIKARHVFAEGVEKGMPEFTTELKSEIESYVMETRMFG